MSGTPQGGKLAAEKNKAIDPDFYKVIGSIGGKVGRTGGFAAGEAGKKRAAIYGAIGGARGRRTKPTQKPSDSPEALKRKQAQVKLENLAETLRMSLRAKEINYETYITRLRELEAKHDR